MRFIPDRLITKTNFSIISIFLIIFILSSIITITNFRQNLDMGDGATFYTFANNIAHGEIIYKDFIHFRTPGSYFLESFFIKIFGPERTSVNLAMAIEAYILYSLTFLVSVLLIFGRKKLHYILPLSLLVVFLPGYLQLRSGLALLAVALYYYSLKYKKDKFLLYSGVVTGLSFCFGQETAILSVIVISLAELFKKRAEGYNLKKALLRYRKILIGLLLGVLPLVGYVLIFSSLKNFLYYVFYYALVLQPKGMNVDFPDFSYNNFIYFVPLIIYLLCFIVLLNTKKTIADAVILTFAILRLVSFMGRTDMPHLFFVLPELFLIIFYTISKIHDINITKNSLKRTYLLAFIFLVIILFSAIKESALLVILAVVIFYAYSFKDRKSPKLKSFNYEKNLQTTIILFFGILLYLLMPIYISTLTNLSKKIYHRKLNYGGVSYQGINTNNKTKYEIDEVSNFIDTKKPSTLFSFPIQPFYYSLVQKHATKFMTYEPQTTVEEQKQSISDLQKNHPEVIIFDPAQAEALSKSLYLISDYIMSNYKVSKEITGQNILWLMEPKKQETNAPLIFSLYKHNSMESSSGVQSSKDGITNSIIQNDKEIFFDKISNAKYLSIATLIRKDSPTIKSCGYVDFKSKSSIKSSIKVCEKDGIKHLNIPLDSDKIVLRLDDGKVLWSNPTQR